MKVLATMFCAFVISLVGTTSQPASSQTSPTNGVPVTMTVTAESKSSSGPPAVTKQDVQVSQSKERRDVTRWDPVDGKFSVAILIDDSLDPSNSAHNIQDIAAWVRTLPNSVPVMVSYGRNGAANIAQDFTTEHAAAAKALRITTGAPAAYTSIYYSLQDLMKRWKTSTGAREIIVVSDGIDQLHGGFGFYSPDLEPTINQAQRGNFIVYPFYARVFDGHGRHLFLMNEGQSALSMLANETGGEFFGQGFDTPVSYEPYLKELTNLLQHQYTLGFLAKPENKSELQRVKVTTELPRVEIAAATQVFVPAPSRSPSD